ncbi:hypothetical protein QCA50_005454 [Cerrena zonata]|uniref:Uncharacterized protein n=1 Tax=Cerrena zonata TaxID=2478898 RepID=A0AAW0GR57_9APHY
MNHFRSLLLFVLASVVPIAVLSAPLNSRYENPDGHTSLARDSKLETRVDILGFLQENGFGNLHFQTAGVEHQVCGGSPPQC